MPPMVRLMSLKRRGRSVSVSTIITVHLSPMRLSTLLKRLHSTWMRMGGSQLHVTRSYERAFLANKRWSHS